MANLTIATGPSNIFLAEPHNNAMSNFSLGSQTKVQSCTLLHWQHLF